MGPGTIPMGRAGLTREGLTSYTSQSPSTAVLGDREDTGRGILRPLPNLHAMATEGRCACVHDLPLVSSSLVSRKVIQGANAVGPLKTGIA